MIHLLNKLSIRKIILPCLLLFLFFNLYLFPKFTMEKDGQALRPLDLRFSYSHADVMLLMEQLGAEGRAVYKTGIIIIDSIYPFVYSLLLISLMAAALTALFGKTSRKLYMALLPAGILLLDFMENLNTISMLNHFPGISAESVTRGAAFTSGKWIFTMVSAGILVMSLITLFVKTFLLKKK